MMREWIGLAALAMWLLILAGCASSTPGTGNDGEGRLLTPCEEPRPGMCTMNYLPVCGVLNSGSQKTYSNACTACSDPDVKAYSEGVCGADGSRGSRQ